MLNAVRVNGDSEWFNVGADCPVRRPRGSILPGNGLAVKAGSAVPGGIVGLGMGKQN